MSKELYAIQITGLKKDNFTASITKLRPELNTIPTHPNFPLQLLIETFRKMKKGETWGLTYDNKSAEKIVLEHPAKSKLENLYSILNGEHKRITKEEYKAFKAAYDKTGDAFYNNRPVSGFVEDGETATLEIKPAPSLFIKKSEEIITKVDPKVDKAGKYSTGYTFHINDADLLFHLREGMKWDTASFDLRTQVSGHDNNLMHHV